jgi:mono/diheme cytochrome c family protein
MLACGQDKDLTAKPQAVAAPKAPTISPASLDEAKQIFAARCIACHGVSGAGNGPQSNELNPRPRNFQDPEWQRSVTDSYLERIVVEGGVAVGKSAVMPPNPDLAGKPELVSALRSLLRSLKD